MTKDYHKLSPICDGPFKIVEVTQSASYKLQREDGFKVPNSCNDDQLRPFYILVTLCTFLFIASYIGICAQSFSQWAVLWAVLCTHICFLSLKKSGDL
jgi:hypothetical protein